MGEWWPAGGGLISRPWCPLPLPGSPGTPFSLRGWGVVVAVLGAVRTRRWGRGPAGRGLTAWARSKYIAPLKLHKERSVMGMSVVKLVGRGVDTLLLNVYYMDEQGKPLKRDLSNALVERLDVWKQGAIEAEGPIVVPWVFEGVNLSMYPHGAGRGQWRWLLTSDLINLCISRGRLNCVAMVRCSSEYLWSCQNLEVAIVNVNAFLYEIFGCDMYLQVSEAHLCADLVGWDVTQVDYLLEFVSRSRKRGGHEETDLDVRSYSYGLQRSGLDFSSRGPMSCCIYDKTRELKRSGKLWFEDLWARNGWEDGQTVWRVEFRFKREALHELKAEGLFHGVEDAYDLPERLKVLWAYAAGHVGGGEDGWPDGWLRLVVPSDEDRTRSRWSTHPAWVEVQRAFLVDPERPEHFGKIIRKRKEQHNIQKGVEAALGYGTSLSAWAGGDLADPGADISMFLHWFAEAASQHMLSKDMDFGAEVIRKRIKLGLQAS